MSRKPRAATRSGAWVHLRVTAEEKTKIEAAADIVGKSVSDFVRGAAETEALRVLCVPDPT